MMKCQDIGNHYFDLDGANILNAPKTLGDYAKNSRTLPLLKSIKFCLAYKRRYTHSIKV